MLRSSTPKQNRITKPSNKTTQHISTGVSFFGSFMIAFGKGHRGLLDGCFLCNESAGLITLAWITDKKNSSLLSIKLKQNRAPLTPGTTGVFEGPTQKHHHQQEIHAFTSNSWT